MASSSSLLRVFFSVESEQCFVSEVVSESSWLSVNLSSSSSDSNETGSSKNITVTEHFSDTSRGVTRNFGGRVKEVALTNEGKNLELKGHMWDFHKKGRGDAPSHPLVATVTWKISVEFVVTWQRICYGLFLIRNSWSWRKANGLLGFPTKSRKMPWNDPGKKKWGTWAVCWQQSKWCTPGSELHNLITIPFM